MNISACMFALAPVVLSSITLAQTGTRDWVSNPQTGNWIGRSDVILDWQTAEDLAVSLGGNLLTIRNEPENNSAQQYTQNVPHWIGYNDVAVEGTWEWSSGESWTYQNWYPLEPGLDNGAVINPDFTNSPGTWFASTGTRLGIIELSQLPWTDWLPPFHISTGYGTMYGACGDVNGDGAPDFVIPDNGKDFYRIFINDGQGWFLQGQLLGGKNDLEEVQIVDFDLDGDEDLVASDSYYKGQLGIALNDGTGTFSPFNYYSDPSGNDGWCGLRCADFTGDGYPDIVQVNASGVAYVFKNNQAGWFSQIWAQSLGSNSIFVETADLDLDGNMDFVTSNEGADTLTICMGKGSGSFTSSVLSTADGPMQVAIEDMNADGVPEILVPTTDWRIRVYERDSTGNYQQKVQIITSARATHPLVEDFNLDGILDVACVQENGPYLEIFYGTGVLQFDPPIQKPTGGNLRSIVASDVTMDGAPDLITFGDAGVTIHHNLWASPDCNGNGIPDSQDIINGTPDCNFDGVPDECEIADDPALDWNGDGILDECTPPNYCTANPNSTGLIAVMSVSGSPLIADNNFTITASQMPAAEWGYFLMAETQGFIPMVGGSSGNLCLGFPFYRFNNAKNGTGKVLNSGAGGTFSFGPDLTNLPQGVVFQIGETWDFQAWYRDGAASTSNLTDGIEVMFR